MKLAIAKSIFNPLKSFVDKNSNINLPGKAVIYKAYNWWSKHDKKHLILYDHIIIHPGLIILAHKLIFIRKLIFLENVLGM